MPDECAHKPLGRAILSLLVAADQRCPAIIGQAHLLYYARSSAKPSDLAKIFPQLQRDADGLCKAVQDVDAAIKNAGCDWP
jgi:hypothetical protein